MPSPRTEFRHLLQLLRAAVPPWLVAGAWMALYMIDVHLMARSLEVAAPTHRAAMGWSLATYGSLVAPCVALALGDGPDHAPRSVSDSCSGRGPSPLERCNGGLVLVTTVSLGAMVLGWSLIPRVLNTWAPSEAVTRIATRYTSMRLLEILPLGVGALLYSVTRRAERRRWMTCAVSVAIGLKAGYVWLSPALDIGEIISMEAGAAGSSVISIYLGMLAGGLYALRAHDEWMLHRLHLGELEGATLRYLIRSGAPRSLVAASWPLTAMVLLGTRAWLDRRGGPLIERTVLESSPTMISGVESPASALIGHWSTSMLELYPPAGTAGLVLILEILVMSGLLAVGLGGAVTQCIADLEAPDARISVCRSGLFVALLLFGGIGGGMALYPDLIGGIIASDPLTARLAETGLIVVGGWGLPIALVGGFGPLALWSEQSPPWRLCEAGLRGVCLALGVGTVVGRGDGTFMAIWVSCTVYIVVCVLLLIRRLETISWSAPSHS